MAETRLSHRSSPLAPRLLDAPPNVQAVAKRLEQGTGEGRPNMLGEETGRLEKALGVPFSFFTLPQGASTDLKYVGAL